MKKNITLFMYSHSSYSDVWAPFFKQADKYMSNYNKVVFSDSGEEKIPEGWKFIKYDESETYSERVSKCLKSIETDLCFLHHEDMFLYTEPNYKLLDEYEAIVMNEDIDFIRLLRSVDKPVFPYKKTRTLFPIPSYSQYIFSVQPSICKTDRLLEMYNNTNINHIRDFEPNVQQVCRYMNMKGLFHYNNEEKKGMFHYDSNAYPYVATAIVKGKWNLSGYPDELNRILKENNINKNIRGET